MLIARIWKGAVRRADGDAYSEYMQATGVPGYASTPEISACSCFAATRATAASS
jgi:hypothetical protein